MNFKRHISVNESGFQMGPMLDIIFILLIQFMVATMFANREDWFKISVPKAAHGSENQEQVREIVLILRANGELFMDKGFSDFAGKDMAGAKMLDSKDWDAHNGIASPNAAQRLKGELGRFHSANRNLKVVIRSDTKAEHGKVVSVLDLCADLDIRNVAFATQKMSR